MLEQQFSISRFQTYQPVTDRIQIQSIPGIPMLITTLSSPGRTVSYCIRSLSNWIPLMNSSHPDNGMNSLQPVWAAASHPRSLRALAAPGFGTQSILSHFQPPWRCLAPFLFYTDHPGSCSTPFLDPAAATCAAACAHSMPPPPSILLVLHCFAWVTSCSSAVPNSSCFLGHSHAHLELVLQ